MRTDDEGIGKGYEGHHGGRGKLVFYQTIACKFAPKNDRALMTKCPPRSIKSKRKDHVISRQQNPPPDASIQVLSTIDLFPPVAC